MVLVVDIGNSVIHLGVYSNGFISARLTVAHTDCAGKMDTVADWFSKNGIIAGKTPVALSSVYKPSHPLLETFFDTNDIFRIRSDMIGVNYSPKDSLGTDRLANIVAFVKRYDKPGAVVDMGSALTVDIIDPAGDFYGGIIFPGPGLSARVLGGSTTLLPNIDVRAERTNWGNSTEQSIRRGIYSSYKLLIPALLEQAQHDLGVSDFYTVACGGWSSLWHNKWHGIDTFDPDHTLKGIGDIYTMFQ